MSQIQISPISKSSKVNTYDNGPQYSGGAAFLSNGNFVITWTDQIYKSYESNPPDGRDGSGTSVWARIL